MATRAEIAAALKAHASSTATSADVSSGMAPPVPSYEVPMSGAQTERADPGAPLELPKEKEYRPPALWGGGLPVPKESGVRDVLNVASGGGTEAVNAAVQGAPAQAAAEVSGGGLTVKPMSPEERAALEAQANPEGGGHLVRIPGGWQPGSKTNAQGETGKDPDAVRAAMELENRAAGHDTKGLAQTQEADRQQYDMLQQVQQNEFRATQSFKKQADELDSNYTNERQQQLAKMQSIQKAMDAVPNAPRTIRERLAAGGVEDKIRFGLAAGFSILGGGMMRDGGRTAQNFLNTVQGTIDAGVKKEADEYARLGDRARMSGNIYAHLRTGLQDDREAMNITKALYYDAAKNTVEQIALQYKMDTQAPQIQQLLAHLDREKQKLILETASTMQDQFSQTDKYNPGGVVQVGGTNTKNQYDSEPLTKGLAAYGEQIEKRGGNSAKRAMSLYQKAIQTMQKGGFAKDEKFWSTFAAMETQNPTVQAATLASLTPNKREAMQLIIEAGSEQLKDEAGKSVTANELAREIMKKGGYSIDSLDRVRRNVAAKRENVYHAVDATHGGRANIVGHAYRAREKLSEAERLNPGIAADAQEAIDPSDLRTQIRGELN